MERKTIGIDLGHCETTAAYPRQTQSDRYEVRRLSLKDKDQVISTQIILTDEQMQKLKGHLRPDYELLRNLGGLQIGNDLPANVPGGEKFGYFKTAPKNFDEPYGNGSCAKQCGITHGMLMACFAFAVVDNLLKFNVGDISAADREELNLLIGCPSTSDWNARDARAAYANLIKTATKVHAVQIIPESRAAMFSSVENGQERISALDGALVFDFGSSTADCTYMLLGRKLLEFSWTLGACQIEREMVRDAYKKAMDIERKGSFPISPASQAGNEDALRAAKEMYYNGKYGSEGHPMFCSFKNTRDNIMVEVPFRIDDQYMGKVVGEKSIPVLCDSRTTLSGSWRELCRAFFREAAMRIDKETYRVMEKGQEKHVPCGVKDIVLTGGASRMAFIYELCREAFPDAHIYREPNPSHTVSNGLAWVAVSDENFTVCKEAARQEIASDGRCDISALRDNICDALFGKVVAVGEERARAWADRPEENVSVRMLQNDLTARVGSPGFQSEVESICSAEIEAWKDWLSATIVNAVNNQVEKLFSEQVAHGLMIPGDIWQELQSGALTVGQIDVGGSIKSMDMSSVALQVGKIVVQAVIWGVAGSLALLTGWWSLIIGGVVSIFAGAAMEDTDLDKPRNKKVRAKVATEIRSKFEEKKSEILKGFRESLEQQTADYSEIVDKTLTAAFRIVTLKQFEV